MQSLRKIMFPFSLIYAMVVYIRNFMYDHGLLSTRRFKTPTICIGNLSVGGTGKTPMTELLIRNLQAKKRIAVLSRGYGRKRKGLVMLSEDSTAYEVGDEPLQLFSKFKDISVVVEADRQKGITYIEKELKPDLILLDDAFQHRRVTPSFSILLTAFDSLYTDDWYLPTGDLRDSKNQAKRADIIIVTKCPSDLSDTTQAEIRNKLDPLPGQEVLFCYFAYEQQLKGFHSKMSLKDLKEHELTLVTGVANPEPLVRYLEEGGLHFEHLIFGDHHYFTEKELQLFNSREYVITTEKDFIRSRDKIDKLSYIEVRHVFLNNGLEVLSAALEKVLGS
ncbi:MAG: tetraacyldisaccharide 4'-kinase [Flavobacteriaceae bacterium]